MSCSSPRSCMYDEEKNSDVPHEFLCPITKEIFVDPVLASDSFTYEKKAINGWFRSQCGPYHQIISPMTGATMTSKRLQTNQVMKTMIAEWKKTNSTTVRQKKILDNVTKSCMMAETVEEVQNSLGKIKNMTDFIVKKECDYENQNGSDQMLTIIYGQVEKLKKRLSRFPEFLNDDIEKMFQHILNSCSSAASSVKEKIDKNNEETSTMKREIAKLDAAKLMVQQEIDEMEFEVNNNLVRFLLKKQYLLKLQVRLAKRKKNEGLLIKKNKELESLLPKSSTLFAQCTDGSGSKSSNSTISTTTTRTPAINKKKRKRGNENAHDNKNEDLNVKEIMVENGFDVEPNYNFSYFLNKKKWQFHGNHRVLKRFLEDHENGRTTWEELESFVARTSHETVAYDNGHGTILLPLARDSFRNILQQQKCLPVSLLKLLAKDYRNELNSWQQIDHNVHCNKTSFMWNRISADSEFHDDMEACAYVGFAYFNGKGVKRSSRNAWPYLIKAANLGHRPSAGICFANGKKIYPIRSIM
eukprot:g14109.t1